MQGFLRPGVLSDLLHHIRYMLLATALLLSASCLAQFPSTDSYALIYEIPKARMPGDTVYVRVPLKPYQKYDAYVLKKIEGAKLYVYRELQGSLELKIAYDEGGHVKYYYYKYDEWGGANRGYFVIHYYPNGNIRDYAQISFSQMNQPGAILLYEPVPHPEADPSKIPHKDYNVFYKRHKLYLYDSADETKVIRGKIRKSKHLEGYEIMSDLPYPTYLLK